MHAALALLAFAAAAFAAAWARARRALRASRARVGALEAKTAALGAAAADLSLAHKVFDLLPVSFFLVTPDHRIAILNRATETLAGMPREQILREGCFGLFCDNKTHFEKCPGHASLFSGKNWDGETEINSRHYAVSVRPIRDGDAIPYSLVTLTDTTDVIHHRSVLEKVVPRLETLLRTSSSIRACMAEFATEQDSTIVIARAMRTAFELFHATYSFLVRTEPDGTLVRIHGEFRSADYDLGYLTPAERGRIAVHFSGLDDLVYRKGRGDTPDPLIERMLERARSTCAFFATIRLDGKIWGYLGFLSDDPAAFSPESAPMRRDLVYLIEIGVRRAKLLHELDREKHELVAATEAAQQASRAKSTFLATMSHEIRTPLNAVIGFSELLANPDLPSSSVREYTSGITRASGVLLNLINDILDLSKLDAGMADMHGVCDLARLFDDMAAIFSWRASSKGVAIRHSITADFPKIDLAEPHMRHILLNLIGNAVKFTDHGVVEWSAALLAEDDGTESLAIDVRDTGIGIAPDMRDSIFDPFVQDINSRGGKVYSGTGLGLPIVRRLLEARHGTIKVDSELGKGSTFHVRIPNIRRIADAQPLLAQPREGAAAQVGNAASASAPAAAPATAPASAAPNLRCGPFSGPRGEEGAAVPVSLAIPPGFRALLVDDIPVNLQILSLHLKGIGITDCELASSGHLALEALRRRRASVVLTDVWMPDGDGSELARAVRADPALSDIPVIAVTADNDVSASFDTTCFDGILTKPIYQDRLKIVLAPFLEAYQPPATAPDNQR